MPVPQLIARRAVAPPEHVPYQFILSRYVQKQQTKQAT
jgi:hypothetical protein